MLEQPDGHSETKARPLRKRRKWIWLLAPLVPAAIGAAWFAGLQRPPTPLEGKFTVYVRPEDRALEFAAVDKPGALPVTSGGAMCLEVQLEQPAFVFILWVDSQGSVTPLYPWNNQTVEVKDVKEPPPVRRATNRLLSPLLPHFWTFGEGQGMETVLLLARREPLPPAIKLGELLQKPPPVGAVRDSKELVVLTLAPDRNSVTTLVANHRGDEKVAAAADEELKQLMLRLGEHFELVRAVRFAHVEPK